MNNTVTVNIRNRQYQGDLLEIQGSDSVDPSSIEEPMGEVIGLGDGIHVADYIEGYDFTNEFDITAALKKAISKAWEISKLRYAQAKKHPREPVIEGTGLRVDQLMHRRSLFLKAHIEYTRISISQVTLH